MTDPLPTVDPVLEPAASPVAQWQATFNAALSGAVANPTLQYMGFDALHEFATRCANRAHGALEPVSTQAVRQVPEVMALFDIARSLHLAYLEQSSHGPISVLDPYMGPLGNALRPFLTEPTP